MISGLAELAQHRVAGRKPARVELDCTSTHLGAAAILNGLSSWWHVAITSDHALSRLDLRPIQGADLVEIVGTDRARVECLAAMVRPLATLVIATQVEWRDGMCKTLWQDFGDGNDAVAA